jgi:hypothetical protein
MKLLPIPAGDAALPKRLHFGERYIAFTESFIRLVGGPAEWLHARLCIGNGAQVVRYVVLRSVILVVAAGSA